MSGKKGKSRKTGIPSHVESAADPGLTGPPDDIFPMVLTSATQELFGCRAEEDVTGDSPYKLLKREHVIQDMKTRAAVSDFSPVKQRVLDYPEEDILLVFDRDFTYGQAFYLVLAPDAKDRILNPPEALDARSEDTADGEEESEELVQSTPEPRPWVSLGSDLEIGEEFFKPSREKLRYKFSRVRREFGAQVWFSDWTAKDSHVDCSPYQDPKYSITRTEQHKTTQAVPILHSSSTQTHWRCPKNMCTQHEPQDLTEEEKQKCFKSENLKNFMNLAASRIEQANPQNNIMDMFVDDLGALDEEDRDFFVKADTQLKNYHTIRDIQLSQDKTISDISLHPTISGVITVAMMEKGSLDHRMDVSTKLLLNPSHIVFWSFFNPLSPQFPAPSMF